MTVNLANADKALKSYYLDAVTEQLDTKVSPFYSMIKKTTNNVWGKEIIKSVRHGVNGGVGAGTEDGDLPSAASSNYAQFVTTLKNLYGTIEISDKAIRASENNSGAFVNLLTSEMEGLVKSASFNFDRMLFGCGDGNLSYIYQPQENNKITLFETRNVADGMRIEFRKNNGTLIESIGIRTILGVDRVNNVITVSGDTITPSDISGGFICLQGSYKKELCGLPYIFENSTIYGLSKAENPWLKPYYIHEFEYRDGMIQEALDQIEESSGTRPNLIITSLTLRRQIYNSYAAQKRFLDSTTLDGGFQALSFGGIPIVTSRFCRPMHIYLLNTEDFELHQLCDWEWLADDDGRVLKQVAGKPVYSATLVKYAELICNRPSAQGLINLTNE